MSFSALRSLIGRSLPGCAIYDFLVGAKTSPAMATGGGAECLNSRDSFNFYWAAGSQRAIPNQREQSIRES